MEFPEGMSIFLCSSEKALILYLYSTYFTRKHLKKTLTVSQYRVDTEVFSGTGIRNLQALHI